MTDYQQLDNLIKQFARVFPGSMSPSLAISKAKAELKKQQAAKKKARKRKSKRQLEDWEAFLLELERGEKSAAQ